MHKHVLILALLCLAPVAQAQTPQRVNFPSHDGKTTLTGYLFLPAAQGRAPAQKRPAIVMMHGRAGAYSSRANGVYDASTLSRRHQAWGETVGEPRHDRAAGRRLWPARLSGRFSEPLL